MKHNVTVIALLLVIGFTIPTIVQEIGNLGIESNTDLIASVIPVDQSAAIHLVSYTGFFSTAHTCKAGQDECVPMSRTENDRYNFDTRSGVTTDSYTSTTIYKDSTCTMTAGYSSGATIDPYKYTQKCTQNGKTTESSGTAPGWPALFNPEQHIGSYKYESEGVSININENASSMLSYDTRKFYPNRPVYIKIPVEAYSLIPGAGAISCGSISIAGIKADSNCIVTITVQSGVAGGSMNVTPSVMSTNYFGYFLSTPSIHQ